MGQITYYSQWQTVRGLHLRGQKILIDNLNGAEGFLNQQHILPIRDKAEMLSVGATQNVPNESFQDGKEVFHVINPNSKLLIIAVGRILTK